MKLLGADEDVDTIRVISVKVERMVKMEHQI
jgi:hypothetical protein